MEKLQLLSAAEASLRIGKVAAAVTEASVDAVLIGDNANKFYLTGRVFAGYVYITATGEVLYFVQRPVELGGDNVIYIRKPEDIPSHLAVKPLTVGLEMDTTCYSTIERLKAVVNGSAVANASSVMRYVRAVKTNEELRLIRMSGVKQEHVYRKIPSLFRPGMTDIELQVEIERLSRLEGCLGQFRVSGDSMELFMGNIIAGENADAPSPYDFAMGGAGIHPSLPVGADGTELRPGVTVMVDVNGNYTGYMTDMTRTFSVGEVGAEALKAHECSIRINRELAAMGQPGTEAKMLYERAMSIAEEEGLAHLFMGHRQHAKFVGHGVGIEINELPVIAPRSRDILVLNNVIALEPKFVIPKVGAVGVENTYVVTPDGLKCITNSPEEIISLDR